jgi:DNA invertase Pin-like site-specific DNA recombinase
MKVVGYLRTSTDRQDLSPDAQRERIAAHTTYKGWELVGWVQDTVSGSTALSDRPGGAYALSLLDSGQADALVVAKLDRLSRNVVDFGTTLELAQRQGWAVVVLDMDVDTSTAAGRVVVQVMSAFAEFERGRMSERMADMHKAKRDRDPDYRPGPKAWVPPEAAEMAKGMRAAGATLPEVAAALNTAGIATAKSGRWHPTSVKRLLARVGDEGRRIEPSFD